MVKGVGNDGDAGVGGFRGCGAEGKGEGEAWGQS